jgi:hypothetical protein
MFESEPRRVPREDVVPAGGRRLVVKCERAGCGRGALLDPRKIFGEARNWPKVGRSSRFRCTCGCRDSQIRYTNNTAQAEGPLSAGAMLWV